MVLNQQQEKFVMFQLKPKTKLANGWGRATCSALLVVMVVGQLSGLVAADEPIFVSKVTISLVRETKISSRDAGLLAQLLATEGMSVRKDELIALLNNDQQQLDVKAAELNLQVATMRADDDTATETASAQLREAKSGKLLKEIALQIAEAESQSDVAVKIANAETQLRQLELSRAQGARKSFKGSISESQIDRLKTSVEKGELETQAAENDHRIKKMKPAAERAAIAQKTDEILRFEALVKQGEKEQVVAGVSKDIRRNELQIAKLNLERKNLRAPFDGVIVEVLSSEGEWVEPGTTIARIIDLKTLRADGFLPVQKASQKLVGRAVTIRISGNAGSAKEVPGKVVFVSPEVDPINQQVRFRAEFENTEMKVLPGMNGALTIEPNQFEPKANRQSL